ncbi:MaoC family dehydratase N-terminal domain-containing protein [Bradyrhizobium sp. Tv2a-2]|uniref:FAS1-like dehydratase domain-containing protein n=1 Tax=Bradyrhizobium sp. Tv2a-2 TaxID=113395 RepID=UPI00041F785F|nr:MaoC family dehydratase N-terminal domain-containing protein [Bradyrhizobium sp. Tv2a-2]
MTNSRFLGGGLYFDQLSLGDRFHTAGRTITEADLNSYVNLTWFTEELFTNVTQTHANAMSGRVVPGGMLYVMAEGLLKPLVERTGLAFLHTEIDVKAPTCVGDTIHVDIEVIELRQAKAGARGLVRTRNNIVNQNGVIVLVYTPLRLVRALGTTEMPA